MVDLYQERRDIMDTKNLKKLRISKRLTQLEMAKDIGVTLNTYRNWESGANQPSDINLEKLKEVLGVKE
jgi:transcriptional regulator with XRE-family HTH domain